MNRLERHMKKLNELLEEDTNKDEIKLYNNKVKKQIMIENKKLNKKDSYLKDLGLKYGYGRYIHRGSNTIQSGGDKAVHGYCNIYENHFKELENKNINFLEIGIFQGRSLAMWNDYFKKGNIYGIDINTKEFDLFKKELKKIGAFKNKDVIVEEGNSTNQILFKDIKFDIILDDGCHKIDSQMKTFNNYFPLLKKNGFYVIEDLRGKYHEKILEDFMKDKNIVYYLENNLIILQK